MIYFILNDQMFHVLPELWLPHWEVLFQILKCGFYLFTVTGFDLWLSVLTLGIVCTIYTALVSAASRGGGRTVVGEVSAEVEWKKRRRDE